MDPYMCYRIVKAVKLFTLTVKPNLSIIYLPKRDKQPAEVAEWQTRYVQGVVSVRAWEFKSPLRHH